ncbi:hypothetical protein EJB05_06044 [Eragrostis curvula]|uniref:Phytocyanin domain-containing protein n=1 Tax=Eragrostis curvula TaxID=38414 RepID=A0A5J9WEN7_9POAL|nr:hypothetical protein EJB05_06044 [Eragrostis curvula]
MAHRRVSLALLLLLLAALIGRMLPLRRLRPCRPRTPSKSAATAAGWCPTLPTSTTSGRQVTASSSATSSDEYNNCQVKKNTIAVFFRTGDTCFVLDRPGLLYFIGSLHKNCVLGQKMVVKMMDKDAPLPTPSGLAPLPAPTPAATPSGAAIIGHGV